LFGSSEATYALAKEALERGHIYAKNKENRNEIRFKHAGGENIIPRERYTSSIIDKVENGKLEGTFTPT